MRVIDISRLMIVSCTQCDWKAVFAYVNEDGGQLQIVDARCKKHQLQEETK